MHKKWKGTPIMSEDQYQRTLAEIAKKNHTTAEEVEREILRVIDETWNTIDPQAKMVQKFLFKEISGKPTPREFISVISHHVGPY